MFTRTNEQKEQILAELYRDCDICRELTGDLSSANGKCSRERQDRAEQAAKENLSEHQHWCHRF